MAETQNIPLIHCTQHNVIFTDHTKLFSH